MIDQKSFVEFLERLGPIWSPCTEPPELGSVPLDAGRMGAGELSEWLGKCTAWLSYAHSQLGLAEARRALLQRRFSRIVNELVVSQGVKQRTYELQVAEVMKEKPDLVSLQEEIAELEAQCALWSRMTRAYEQYVTLFRDESNKRRWSKE